MAYDFLEDLEDDLSDEELETLGLLEKDYKGSSQAIHDRLQFQADVDVDLTPIDGEERQKQYRIDTYLFLPKNMGVNRDNFSRDQFYTSITNYMRIRTPTPPEDNQAFELGPIPSADRYFQVHLITHLRQPLESLVVQDTKLFGCFLNAQLKKARSYLLELMRKQPSHFAHRLRLLEKFMVRLLQALSDYRLRYMHKVRHQSYLMEPEVRKAFLLVDEYLSYRLEATLIYMFQRLDGRPGCEEFGQLLESALGAEMEYRAIEDLILLSHQTDVSVRETYYYRLGLLKKYVSDVLYLQQTNVRKDKAYRNLVAAAGAALAALWAGLVDLQRFYFLNQPGEGVPFSDFGIRFFLIVVIGVVAYIFKDRIKESSREFFYERLKQNLPDFEFEMNYRYYDHQAKTERALKIGKSRQNMRFITKAALPPEVSYVRELGHHSELDPERSEHVLHYSQQMVLDTHSISETTEQIHVLRNIMRLSIAQFIEKLDNPDKNLRYYDQEHGISMIKAPKVYHLNVIFRYAWASGEGHDSWRPAEVEFERIRLILDKQGIQRIETVLPRGTFGYVESHL
ncbi:MAG: hypothetical protein CVV27_16695 [Candidatus Melainabacteria bacterium HGW-Melainabacteria-1]|nr:MAG: hypothetical protein CVV27_16695 [Candidatus Melainabacteria bacterium HGW-Melainabacteria-1]